MGDNWPLPSNFNVLILAQDFLKGGLITQWENTCFLHKFSSWPLWISYQVIRMTPFSSSNLDEHVPVRVIYAGQIVLYKVPSHTFHPLGQEAGTELWWMWGQLNFSSTIVKHSRFLCLFSSPSSQTQTHSPNRNQIRQRFKRVIHETQSNHCRR